MKTFSNTLKGLLITWLCLVSSINLQSLPDFVLCYGEDGHIELEIAVNDRCGSEASPEFGFAALQSLDADHCGECSDIPLVSKSTQWHFEKAGTAPSAEFQPLGLLFPASVIRYAPPPPKGWPPPPPPSVSTALIAIRTVRLLV